MTDRPDEIGSPILSRDPESFLNLPVEFRWEFTRRHPYYLAYWSLANQCRVMDKDQMIIAMAMLSRFILYSIGVTATDLVAPDTPFSELGAEQVDAELLKGPVQLLSLRALLTHLIATLPVRELEYAGRLCQFVAEGPERELPGRKKAAFTYVAHFASQTLDSFADIPMYYIHMGASIRNITASLEKLVRRRKQLEGRPDTRIHERTLAAKLKTWDLREGWTGGGYDAARELTFDQISKSLKIPKTTAVDQYKSAFRLITGHDFSPENWVLITSSIKPHYDSTRLVQAHARRYHRLIQAASSSEPTETTVGISTAQWTKSLVREHSTSSSEQDIVELRLDIHDLIEEGLSNAEIVEKLGVDEAIVEYFRPRLDEFKQSRRSNT